MPAPVPVEIRFGIYAVDVCAGELRKNGTRVKLEARPFQILAMLLEGGGRVVTREELRSRLWPDGTFVDFDHSINSAVRKLRDALCDAAATPRYVETVGRRGYRFIYPVEGRSTLKLVTVDESSDANGANGSGYNPETVVPVSKTRPTRALGRWKFRVALWFLLLAAVALVIYGRTYRHRSQMEIRPLHTIIVADFSNNTGDAVFNDTLKLALTVELEQSPFLNILSDTKVAQGLRMMERLPNEPLTMEVARELCQRLAANAVLTGSITKLDNQYVVGLRASSCRTGDSLGDEQARAIGKEQVLPAMDKAAAKLRARLGESLASVQEYDTPAEQATTSSLEALQAYSLGRKALMAGNFKEAISRFDHASRLDPDFAMSYMSLAVIYSNMRESNLAEENATRAYELRARVSQREKYYIESHYFDLLGDVEDARQTYDVWAKTYPGDYVPLFNLGNNYASVGQYEKGLELARTSLRLDPGDALNYGNLMAAYGFLNRFSEARAIAREAQARNFDSPVLHVSNYVLDFWQNDQAGMALEAAWARGNSEVDDVLLAAEAATAGYYGRLATARTLSARAVASAEGQGASETAAMYEAEAALREALFGNVSSAAHYSSAALARSTGRDVLASAILALALSGDSAQAQNLVNGWAQSYPQDSLAKFNFLPTARAAIAMSQHDPAKAVAELEATTPYELGRVGSVSLAPVFMRGQAYLLSGHGKEAESEFQKILDHPGIVGYSPLGALAHLGLARAYAFQGETAKARAAYQDFLTLWKDADPDIPILQQAKAEYAKLK